MEMFQKINNKNLTFTELREELEKVRKSRFDVVLSSGDLKVHEAGCITTPAQADILTDDGVGIPVRDWMLTPHAFRQWAAKFGVPYKYLASLSDWGEDLPFNQLGMDIMRTHHEHDEKTILMRGVIGDDNNGNYCRAILSPSYNFIENFDVLTAIFDGLGIVKNEHGIGFEPGPASITDTSMRARINMPQLSVVADALLADYVSPFTGNKGLDNPVVFMGIEVRNSEVGAGSFTLVPSVVIQVCDNGLTLTNDIFRKVHLGAPMESGQISKRTLTATMELITTQTIDKVVEIANPEFLRAKVDELMGLKEQAVVPSIVNDYLKDAFDEEVANSLFDEFIHGSDLSAFGVAQAITSFSQRPEVSAEEATKLDDSALDHAIALAAV